MEGQLGSLRIKLLIQFQLSLLLSVLDELLLSLQKVGVTALLTLPSDPPGRMSNVGREGQFSLLSSLPLFPLVLHRLLLLGLGLGKVARS